MLHFVIYSPSPTSPPSLPPSSSSVTALICIIECLACPSAFDAFSSAPSATAYSPSWKHSVVSGNMFPTYYGIYVEEDDTCEAKLPRINGNVERKSGHRESKVGYVVLACGMLKALPPCITAVQECLHHHAHTRGMMPMISHPHGCPALVSAGMSIADRHAATDTRRHADTHTHTHTHTCSDSKRRFSGESSVKLVTVCSRASCLGLLPQWFAQPPHQLERYPQYLMCQVFVWKKIHLGTETTSMPQTLGVE